MGNDSGQVTRRSVLAAGAAMTPHKAAPAAPHLPTPEILKTYIGFGDKASGGAGDMASLAWMEGRLQAFGYQTRRQAIDVPFFTAHSTRLKSEIFDLKLEPQAQVMTTGAGGLTAPLARLDGFPKPGAIVVAALPYRRWSSASSPEILSAGRAAVSARASGLILVTTGPTGEALALNVPAERRLFELPTAVLAPAAARPVLDAATRGDTATLIVDGDAGRRPAFNLIGRLDRGAAKTLILSTPRSGWYGCGGERGPGVVVWLRLAQWAVSALPGFNIVLISASGHEYDNHGAHAFLKTEAPKPGETALWVHLGANVAARDWREAAMGMLSPLPSADPQRILMGSTEFVPMLGTVFAGEPGLEAPLAAGAAAAGELDEIFKAGYPRAFGIFGAHRFHHARSDDARCVEPALIDRLVPKFKTAIKAALA